MVVQSCVFISNDVVLNGFKINLVVFINENRTVRGGKPTSPLCGVLKSDLSFVTFKIVYKLEIFTI